MLTTILKIICYSFSAFILFCIFMVFGQFFTDINNLIWLLGLALVVITIIFGIKYRQKHPYKPKSRMDKETKKIIFWTCLCKILTGKKR